MKSSLVYILAIAAVVAWLWVHRRRQSDTQLQDHLAEQDNLRRLGQLKGNATIFSTPPFWAPLVEDFDPQIFTPATPINDQNNADDSAVWNTPVYPEYGTAQWN